MRAGARAVAELAIEMIAPGSSVRHSPLEVTMLTLTLRDALEVGRLEGQAFTLADLESILSSLSDDELEQIAGHDNDGVELADRDTTAVAAATLRAGRAFLKTVADVAKTDPLSAAYAKLIINAASEKENFYKVADPIRFNGLQMSINREVTDAGLALREDLLKSWSASKFPLETLTVKQCKSLLKATISLKLSEAALPAHIVQLKSQSTAATQKAFTRAMDSGDASQLLREATKPANRAFLLTDPRPEGDRAKFRRDLREDAINQLFFAKKNPSKAAVQGFGAKPFAISDLDSILSALEPRELEKIAALVSNDDFKELTVVQAAAAIVAGRALLKTASGMAAANLTSAESATLIIDAASLNRAFQQAASPLRLKNLVLGTDGEVRRAVDGLRKRLDKILPIDLLTVVRQENLVKALTSLEAPRAALARQVQALVKTRSSDSSELTQQILLKSDDPRTVLHLLREAAKEADRAFDMGEPQPDGDRAVFRKHRTESAVREVIAKNPDLTRNFGLKPDRVYDLMSELKRAASGLQKNGYATLAEELTSYLHDLQAMFAQLRIPPLRPEWAPSNADAKDAIMQMFHIRWSKEDPIVFSGLAPDALQDAMVKHVADISDKLSDKLASEKTKLFPLPQVVGRLVAAGVSLAGGHSGDVSQSPTDRLNQDVGKLHDLTHGSIKLVQALLRLTENNDLLIPIEKAARSEHSTIRLSDGARGELAGTQSMKYAVEPGEKGGLLVRCSYSLPDARQFMTPDHKVIPLASGSANKEFTVRITSEGVLSMDRGMTERFSVLRMDERPDSIHSILAADPKSVVRVAFKNSVTAGYRAENLYFHEKLVEFNTSPTLEEAKALAQRFVRENAPDQVNLAALLRKSFLEVIDGPDAAQLTQDELRSAFAPIHSVVTDLMQTNDLKMFLVDIKKGGYDGLSK